MIGGSPAVPSSENPKPQDSLRRKTTFTSSTMLNLLAHCFDDI